MPTVIHLHRIRNFPMSGHRTACSHVLTAREPIPSLYGIAPEIISTRTKRRIAIVTSEVARTCTQLVRNQPCPSTPMLGPGGVSAFTLRGLRHRAHLKK